MSETKKTPIMLFRPWSEVHSSQMNDRDPEPGIYEPLKLLKLSDQALPAKPITTTTAVTVTPTTSTTIAKPIEQTRKEAKVEKPVVKEG